MTVGVSQLNPQFWAQSGRVVNISELTVLSNFFFMQTHSILTTSPFYRTEN